MLSALILILKFTLLLQRQHWKTTSPVAPSHW